MGGDSVHAAATQAVRGGRSYPMVIYGVALLAVLLLGAGAAVGAESVPDTSADWEPWEFRVPQGARAHSANDSLQADEPDAVDPSRLPRTLMMRLYRSAFSPVRGTSCSMYPSCSAFAEAAIESRGVVVGFVLACDRLVRCGNDLQYYEVICENGYRRRHDPVPGPRGASR